MAKPPRRPREGNESLWAGYFAAQLREQGFEEAARALAAGRPAVDESRRLPRGVYEKVTGSGDYWIRFADPTGKIRRQHVGRSLAAARDIAEQRRTEVRQGKFNPDSVGRKRKPEMTVRQMFETYLPLRVKVRNKSEDQRYADYWSGLFGSLTLDELTPLELERWRARRSQQVKPATVNRALEYLKAFYNLAFRDGRCKSNPAIKVELLEENNQRTRFLQDDEEGKLEKTMDADDFDLVLLAVNTGLRRAEQFKLRWEFVDFANTSMKIPDTKAGRHRFVRLNMDAVAVLHRLRARAGESEWVFPSLRRPEVHRSAQNFVQRVFDVATEAAGIKDLTWHDLRRTFGSRLALAGKPLHTIGELMGHRSPNMTKRYAHLLPGHLQEAVESLTRPVNPVLEPVT